MTYGSNNFNDFPDFLGVKMLFGTPHFGLKCGPAMATPRGPAVNFG